MLNTSSDIEEVPDLSIQDQHKNELKWQQLLANSYHSIFEETKETTVDECSKSMLNVKDTCFQTFSSSSILSSDGKSDS